MTRSIASESEAVWHGDGHDELRLRLLAPGDLEAISEALALGEGYTSTGAAPQTAVDIRADLAGYGEAHKRDGFVVADTQTGSMRAFILFLVRNRLTDAFAATNPLGALPLDVFPADGCFLQIHDLWVDGAFRRRGVARTLKRVLEAEASVRNVQMIYTVTEATHRAALELNASLGYVEVFRGPMWDPVERVGLARYLPV